MARVVFFGSPDFAVPSLLALETSSFKPILVVSQPDRPSGRGRHLMPTPVRRAAEQRGLPVSVVESFRDEEKKRDMMSLDADFFVVVAFGLIFPSPLLRVARKGNINLHASLLPAYRGASPVNAAVVHGDAFTGVTTMEMVASIDAGPIYLQRVVPIDPLENAGELLERLATHGADLLLETLRGIEEGTCTAVPQPEAGASAAPRLSKRDGLVPWGLNAIDVHNHIRGMNPWPGSFTRYRGSYLKIHRAAPHDLVQHGEPPGTILRTGPDGIIVACRTGSVTLLRLQHEGKRPLDAGAFIRGSALDEGTILGE
jgi:methionyl-tRNA formyltransferase